MNKIAFEVPQDYTLTRDRDSLKLVWHIECSSDQTLQTVRTLDGVPRIGSQSPLAPNLFASKIRFEMRTPRYFRAAAEYTSGNSSTVNSAEDLSDRPPEIRYFDECEMVPLEFCYSGDSDIQDTPVLNSAGDRFPEIPLVPRQRLRIELSWFTDKDMTGQLPGYFNTLNRNAIRLDGHEYAAQTLWCVRLQSSLRTNAAGKEFSRLELTLRHDPENWNCKILQAGFNALDDTGKKYPIRLADGEYSLEQDTGVPVTDPVLLDENGKILSANAAAVYSEFRYLPLADWNGLDIPTVKALHSSFGRS
jgi:hypothetical protein